MGEFTEEWVRAKAHRLYVEAEAQMDIEPGHTALLVIDMTDEFVKPHWSPYWVPAATRAVPRIKAVIDAFRQAGWPVIYLAYQLGQRGLNFPVTDRLVPTTLDTGPFAEFLWKTVSIFADIAPGDSDLVVLKHCYSGFQGTELEFVLRSLDVLDGGHRRHDDQLLLRRHGARGVLARVQGDLRLRHHRHRRRRHARGRAADPAARLRADHGLAADHRAAGRGRPPGS
jgi:hypothetical protein